MSEPLQLVGLEGSFPEDDLAASGAAAVFSPGEGRLYNTHTREWINVHSLDDIPDTEVLSQLSTPRSLPKDLDVYLGATLVVYRPPVNRFFRPKKQMRTESFLASSPTGRPAPWALVSPAGFTSYAEAAANRIVAGLMGYDSASRTEDEAQMFARLLRAGLAIGPHAPWLHAIRRHNAVHPDRAHGLSRLRFKELPTERAAEAVSEYERAFALLADTPSHGHLVWKHGFAQEGGMLDLDPTAELLGNLVQVADRCAPLVQRRLPWAPAYDAPGMRAAISPGSLKMTFETQGASPGERLVRIAQFDALVDMLNSAPEDEADAALVAAVVSPTEETELLVARDDDAQDLQPIVQHETYAEPDSELEEDEWEEYSVRLLAFVQGVLGGSTKVELRLASDIRMSVKLPDPLQGSFEGDGYLFRPYIVSLTIRQQREPGPNGARVRNVSLQEAHRIDDTTHPSQLKIDALPSRLAKHGFVLRPGFPWDVVRDGSLLQLAGVKLGSGRYTNQLAVDLAAAEMGEIARGAEVGAERSRNSYIPPRKKTGIPPDYIRVLMCLDDVERMDIHELQAAIRERFDRTMQSQNIRRVFLAREAWGMFIVEEFRYSATDVGRATLRAWKTAVRFDESELLSSMSRVGERARV
ncbi:MAG: hypothetical protein V3V08_00535 [Nannocystaceae bacterium]